MYSYVLMVAHRYVHKSMIQVLYPLLLKDVWVLAYVNSLYIAIIPLAP